MFSNRYARCLSIRNESKTNFFLSDRDKIRIIVRSAILKNRIHLRLDHAPVTGREFVRGRPRVKRVKSKHGRVRRIFVINYNIRIPIRNAHHALPISKNQAPVNREYDLGTFLKR